MIDETLRFLPWAILSPLISAPCFLLDGVMIGAVQSRVMRNSMLVSTLILFLGMSVFVPTLGNHGLWLAFIIFMACRGLTLLPTALELGK